MPRALTVRAPAKLNLHLDVGPRRADGYHGLKTIFQETSLHDTLRFSLARRDVRLRISPRGPLPTDERNLIVRALLALRERLGVSAGASVRLVKRIPMGAGLGGGSSDAAAALIGGWRLWTARPARRLPPFVFDIARRLGADVPFFLLGGTAWGEGIGDRLTPMPVATRRWVAIVYPRVHVSTVEAYGALDASRPRSWRAPRGFSRRSAAPALRRALSGRGPWPFFNSFEPVIASRHPAIRAALDRLSAAGCSPVMMSGSGSAVFGICRNAAHARAVRRAFRSAAADVHLATIGGRSR